MKKSILISLLFLFLTNIILGQSIEEFSKIYRDTSLVLNNNINRSLKFDVFNVGDIYPTTENTDFIYEIGNIIKTNGYLSYTLIDNNYEKKINSTRRENRKSPLVIDNELNKLALERCIRMINLIIDKNSIVSVEAMEVYEEEVHKKATTSENGHMPIFYKYNKRTYFLKNPSSGYTDPRISLLSIYSEQVYHSNKDENFTGIDIQLAWNKSDGHLNNRTNEKYTKFGYAYVIAEGFIYDGYGKKIRFTISSAYEVFR